MCKEDFYNHFVKYRLDLTKNTVVFFLSSALLVGLTVGGGPEAKVN